MKNKYKPTIGLEIHIELKTETKMFCDSKNDPLEKKPNVNICPICVGHPGTLPVVNKEAVKNVLKVGLAVGSEIADFTEFDRKNYFYPDIPKGYQISQYKFPLVSGGELAGVKITRVHLEEDTARSTHEASGYSFVDFNRAGVPLMELVTEPVIESGEQAVNFAKELQLLLRALKVSDADMEKGQMRIEANISVSDDLNKLGTKVEIKNLNSFRSVGKSVAFEIERQIKMLEKGEKIIQETRGWNEIKENTVSQRIKEESNDYRYFPDPDIPKLWISEVPEFSRENLNREIPELPQVKKGRMQKEFGINPGEIQIIAENKFISNFFEKIISKFNGDKNLIKLSVNYIISDYIGLMKLKGEPSEATAGMVTQDSFAELMRMIFSRTISSRGAKDILFVLYNNGGNPQEIAEKMGLFQKSGEKELKDIANKIIVEQVKAVEEYKKGKESALQFLIGQGMKESKGSANPEALKIIFVSLLV